MVTGLSHEHHAAGRGNRRGRRLPVCGGRVQWDFAAQHCGKVCSPSCDVCVIAFRYDPKVNQWTQVASMQVKRKHLGVAVIDNELYAVGGRDDNFELSSVERSVNKLSIPSSFS